MIDLSSALVTRVASLRDNPQYSDLEIITPTRSFHAHKIILSARSSDWGRGVDLSTSVLLDWKEDRGGCAVAQMAWMASFAPQKAGRV